MILSLDDILKKAERDGISRGAIGIKVFGRKAYANIYTRKNPEYETIVKIYNAYLELLEEKNNKKQ